MIEGTIEGIQEAQDRNLRRYLALKPSGALGQAVQLAGLTLHRYAVTITHVESGALKASHRLEVKKGQNAAEGLIFIDPASVNPDTGERPHQYGVYENARGGSHAFYTRTANEAGPKVVKMVIDWIKSKMRRP